MCCFSWIRSLEGSVSSRLSSMTLFMDSIQLASRSPSSMIHLGWRSETMPRSRIVFEMMPSFHSRVAMLTKPRNSFVLTTLGLKSTTVVLSPTRVLAFLSTRHRVDLKDPGLPIRKTQCRIPSSSMSRQIFSSR